MRRLILTLLGLLCLGLSPSLAQQVLDPAAAAIVCAYNSSPPAIATGGFVFAQCDTNGKLIASSGSNTGGYSFQLAPTITVQTAAYASGNSMGGLITATGAARTAGGSGTLMSLRLANNAGSVVALTVYAWSKTPAATCTDKAAFVRSATDAPYALPGFPVTLTPATAGAWDATSYVSSLNIAVQFKNQDTSPGTAIYLCIIAGGAVTPAATTDLSIVLTGLQD